MIILLFFRRLIYNYSINNNGNNSLFYKNKYSVFTVLIGEITTCILSSENEHLYTTKRDGIS